MEEGESNRKRMASHLGGAQRYGESEGPSDSDRNSVREKVHYSYRNLYVCDGGMN